VKIDRAHFLLVTTALAGATMTAAFIGACTTAAADKTADGGLVDSGNTTADSSADGSTTDGSITSDATTDAAADSAACLGDKVVSSPTCEGLAATDAGASSCASSINGGNFCFQMEKFLRTEVAAQAKDCLVKGPCDEGPTPALQSCIGAAVAQACPDTTAAAKCAEAKAQCAEAGTMATVTEAQCVVAYPAFSAAGRDYFQTCPDGEGGCRLSEACFLGVYPRVGD